MNYIKLILKVLFTIIFFQINSCGLKVVERHGQIYEKDIDFKELKIGKTTKNEIIESLGSPSTKSIFDDGQNWIYVSSEFKKYVFLEGKNTDQKVLILSFNRRIELSSFSIFNLSTRISTLCILYLSSSIPS